MLKLWCFSTFPVFPHVLPPEISILNIALEELIHKHHSICVLGRMAQTRRWNMRSHQIWLSPFLGWGEALLVLLLLLRAHVLAQDEVLLEQFLVFLLRWCSVDCISFNNSLFLAQVMEEMDNADVSSDYTSNCLPPNCLPRWRCWVKWPLVKSPLSPQAKCCLISSMWIVDTKYHFFLVAYKVGGQQEHHESWTNWAKLSGKKMALTSSSWRAGSEQWFQVLKYFWYLTIPSGLSFS